MKIRMSIGIVFLLLAGSFGLPLRAFAVSPSPVPGERAEKIEKGIRVKGEQVCLFQSGTADVKKSILVNDVLLVFRARPGQEQVEVGRVRVLSYAGDDYIKGEVVDGEVQAGDIAKKGDAAGLVISSDEKCK